MITALPEHAEAVRAFVRDCLNLDDQSAPEDPLPFPDALVRWAPLDTPRPPNRYALLTEISHVAYGPPESQLESVDVDEVTEDLIETTRQVSEWTITVQVVNRLSDTAPDLAASAGRYLRRVELRTQSSALTWAMRSIGCAWRRSGQILALPRIARGSQWETRAALDLTFAVGEGIVNRPGWIDSVAGSITLAPLPAQAFTADDDD